MIATNTKLTLQSEIKKDTQSHQNVTPSKSEKSNTLPPPKDPPSISPNQHSFLS